MPCRSGIDEEQEAIKEVHRVTRVACDMKTILRRANLEGALTEETRQWITEHDAYDEKRIAEEEFRGERELVKHQAMEKLTMDERRVLGL